MRAEKLDALRREPYLALSCDSIPFGVVGGLGVPGFPGVPGVLQVPEVFGVLGVLTTCGVEGMDGLVTSESLKLFPYCAVSTCSSKGGWI